MHIHRLIITAPRDWQEMTECNGPEETLHWSVNNTRSFKLSTCIFTHVSSHRLLMTECFFQRSMLKKNPNTDSNIKCFLITKRSFWSYRRLKFQPSNSAAWSIHPTMVQIAERKSAKVSLSSNKLQQTHISGHRVSTLLQTFHSQ